ncbi:murein hydrolase activator [Gammaproteobacteria bacterium]
MLKPFYKKVAIIILCLTCLCAPAGAASNHVKLKSLLKQITKVKTDIDQKEKQQVSVEQQLKNFKAKIKILETNYRITLKNLKQQKNVLAKLGHDQAKQQLKLKEARQKFSAQMVAAYQIGQSNYLKTIFNKESHISPDLLLAYHQYIFVARLQQMHNIKRALDQIALNKQQIEKQTKILENLESKQQQQKQELVQTEQEHNKILGSLKNKIATQTQKLEQLISAKRGLEKLIERLSRLGPSKTVIISPELMVQLCRHFVWPTKGEVIIHFGSPIEQSYWSWSGIIIAAPENQGIHAISSGRVVYADWFTGYGLLLIIDHGSGYMSLYGHNKGFRKKLGDHVETGEMVAVVGKSGSEEFGLYFAIRYNGRPVNPEHWCR